MKESYDVIIIGGGHNGLTAATMLAKRGKKVFLVERRPMIGGIAAGEEFYPGYWSNGLVHDTTNVHVETVRALHLENYGLQLEPKRPEITLLGKNGESVNLSDDVGQTSDEIGRISKIDAKSYLEYQNFIKSIRPFLQDLMWQTPPDLMKLGSGDLWTLVKKAIGLKRLGNKTMLEFLKVAPMSVADFLNERFETDFIKAGIAGPALYHSFTGPWSSYTTLNLLLWECFANNHVIGGPRSLVTALEKAAEDCGVDTLTGTAVEKILLNEKSHVCGVALADGQKIMAPMVASSCTPKVTFYDLLKPNQVEYSLEYGIKHYRSRGTAAKVSLALNSALTVNGQTAIEYARTGNSFDEMEQAFDSVKYRQFSQEPVLDIHVPTISDPGLAPDGHHVVSVLVHYAPYDLEEGWSRKQNELLENNVIRTLEQYAPELSKSIVASEVLSPRDLEDRYNLSNGQIYHGEHAIDQILTRPLPSCMKYSTPIEGLFLCGSGSHPGGGISCVPGALASEAILRGT